jgi:Domain of unknown function (DUF5122) beta-propeller
VLSSGNIAVAGYGTDANGHRNMALAVYNATGTLATSSSNTLGYTLTNVNGQGSSTANGIMVESSGKILVTGQAQINYAGTLGMVVVQYNSDGSIDPTFGAGGVAIMPTPASSDGLAIAPITTSGTVTFTVVGQVSGSNVLVSKYMLAPTTDTYGYDVRNRMIYADVPAQNVGPASYVYDDSGNLISESYGVGTTNTYTYVIDTQNPTGYPQQLEQHVNGASAPAITYFIGNDVFGQANGSTIQYFIRDGQGNVRLNVTGNGSYVLGNSNDGNYDDGYYYYDAFGDTVDYWPYSDGTTHQRSDGVFDPGSGLYMFGDGFRYGINGWFYQSDSMGFSNNQQPLSLNKYLYADADPVNGNDPSGHDWVDDIFNEAASDAASPMVFASQYTGPSSPFLPDPTQKPPGWNPSWPTGVEPSGRPFVQDPATGIKYYPDTKQPESHWPHYDTSDGQRYPYKSLKPQPGQKKIKPNSNVSPTNPWDDIAKAIFVGSAIYTAIQAAPFIFDAAVDATVAVAVLLGALGGVE